nr:unnamed protein product [Spirometra erinaceieuropaei]
MLAESQLPKSKEQIEYRKRRGSLAPTPHHFQRVHAVNGQRVQEPARSDICKPDAITALQICPLHLQMPPSPSLTQPPTTAITTDAYRLASPFTTSNDHCRNSRDEDYNSTHP